VHTLQNKTLDVRVKLCQRISVTILVKGVELLRIVITTAEILILLLPFPAETEWRTTKGVRG
jgi:hypothetical protein